MSELYRLHYCRPDDKVDHPPGSLLIESDLKVKEWLESVLYVIGIGELGISATPASNPAANAVSHEVIFEVLTNANLTPSFKLTHVQVNKAGTLFSASRDRKHDLLMTFGPADKANRTLLPSAAASFAAQETGAAISNRPNGLASP